MIKSKSSIFYIDQQSYGNLSMYDYSLLSRIDRSVEIHYFCNRLYDAEMLEHNIHYHKIFRYSGKQGLAKKVSYTLSVLKLLLFIILYAPKVIHQQWIKATFLDLIIWKISKRFFNTKIIYTAHNVLPHIGTIKSNDEYKKVYSVCDVIISHTLTSQKELAATFPETENKIQIIPHGVLDFNISQSEINDAKSVILQQYDLKGKLILGMFGFQSLYKGSDIIFKLWSECPELSANDNLRLLVIGKSEQDILPASLPSNVIVVDRYVANEEFEAFMELTNVILMPYRRIDQSGLLLTVANKKIPFCVSDVGELTKPLEIADVGWSFPSLEADDVKTKILEIVSSPDIISIKKNNAEGWQKVQQYYDWSKSAILTERLYKLYC